MINLSDRVKARLFAGILVTSEIRMHMNASQSWKNASIEAAHGSDDLIEVKHGSKNYVGCYLSSEKVQITELLDYESTIIEKLTTYCPNLVRNSCHFHVFPQLLVS